MRILFSTLTTIFAAIALIAGANAQDYAVPDDAPEHVKRGVESAARTEEHQARDSGRRPAEVLTLAGLNEGARVVELASFGQYYTTILAEAVGPEGMVHMYDTPFLAAFDDGNVGMAGEAFAEARGNAEYAIVDFNEIALPDEVDAAFNVLFYHDFQGMSIDAAQMNAGIFAALKPGGRYIVIDHKAEDGSGWRDASTLHRIGKEAIIEEVTGAGFDLMLDSDLLSNPDDDKSVIVFSPAVRGSTDRAFLVFQKPDAE